MDKIKLLKEKETLLIPLIARAKESKKESPIIFDEKAITITDQIDYDFKKLKIPEKTNIMMCIRAKMLDDYVKRHLFNNKNCAVIHLGCGLDSRYERLRNNNVIWYDVDFEEVIELRKTFYETTKKYHMIASSVIEEDWIQKIQKNFENYLVVAEGLFMYLEEKEIKNLLKGMKDHIGSFTLVFDAYSQMTAKHAKNHPSLKKTGAKIQWGIDDEGALEQWDLGIQFIKEKYFHEYDGLDKLDILTRVMFKISSLFKAAKKAHRLLIYKTY